MRWRRRNRLVAVSLAGIVGIFLAAFSLVTWSYFRAEDARKLEAKQREEAQENERAERWERYRSNIAAASAALQLQNSVTARSALKMHQRSTATGNGTTSTASSTGLPSCFPCRVGR